MCSIVRTLGWAIHVVLVPSLPNHAGDVVQVTPGVAATQASDARAPIDFKTLLAVLEGSADEKQWTTMQAFAAQPDAPAAIPLLCEEMRKAAPRLDNNVGLMIEAILTRHKDARCPMEPLLEGITRKRWNSQQKCAQALALLLERGDGKGREKELAATLIPLLASQRPRVFNAAERCLEALTGEHLGNTPDRWLEWYAQRFDSQVDMTGAVYEDLVVVQSALAGEVGRTTPVYRIEGEEIVKAEVLQQVLEIRAQDARQKGLGVGVSIQISNERMNAHAHELGKLFSAEDVQAVMNAASSLGITDIVVSPESDAFRAPWKRKS